MMDEKGLRDEGRGKHVSPFVRRPGLLDVKGFQTVLRGGQDQKIGWPSTSVRALRARL